MLSYLRKLVVVDREFLVVVVNGVRDVGPVVAANIDVKDVTKVTGVEQNSNFGSEEGKGKGCCLF